MIIITGKTFEHRDRLKDMGGRWNADNKNWEFNSLTDRQRQELKTLVGVMVSEIKQQLIDSDDDWFDDNDDGDETVDGKQRSNIIGDDRTWFNYFADKNPITFFGFSSLSAMTKYVKAIPEHMQEGKRGRGWNETDGQWFGTTDMNEALSLARDGWPDGVEMAQEILERLLGQHAIERRRKYSIAGGMVNVGRLLAGNPKHMIARPKQAGRKIITFFVETFISASISAEHAIIRAATVAAITDVLEMNGYSCEIVSIATSRHSNLPAFHVATTLKATGETLNLNDVIFALGHPSYFRRMIFACNGSDDALRQVWSSMGYPTNAFNANYPIRPNEYYVNKIDYRAPIDDELPLVQSALQIWDLIVSDELPITLNREDTD